ncbi:alginate O-acetyltransferase AlgX-related protein [Roseivivax sp. CAU 1761]
MTRLLSATRYALPLLFLGYAGYVNVSIFSDWDGLGQTPENIAQGGATAALDDLYSAEQPHRDLAVSALGAARYLGLGEGRPGVTVGRDGWLFTDEEMRPAEPAQIATGLEQVRAVAAQLAEHGAELVVIPLPAKVDLYRDRGPDGTGAAMAEQYAAFRDGLAAAGIAHVDARPALRAAASETPVFLTRDTHWTPDGARAVAQAAAASNAIEPGGTEFVRRADRPEEFVGDLVSFVTSEALAPEIGLAPERVTPYVAEEAGGTSGGIFATEAASIDTVLVGTSYSANPNWSFAPALKLALGRDILNLAEEGQGPFAPMQALLSDPALAETPPRYVLWEIPVRYLGEVAPGSDRPQTATPEIIHG